MRIWGGSVHLNRVYAYVVSIGDCAFGGVGGGVFFCFAGGRRGGGSGGG